MNIKETVQYIKSKYDEKPFAGIVLGSGLGNLTAEIQIDLELPYDEIPHFPVATVEGHHGRLIFGTLSGKKIVAMAGRFHYYEGYSAKEVAYPIRILHALGIQYLLISNAAGGLNTGFKVGDLMIINDHISFFIVNPLIGKNDDEIGPRFPDMSEPYSKDIIVKAEEIASEFGFTVKKGVYAGVTGPTFESRSEYKLLRALGGDAVGMSTVQEVIVARHAGLPVFAISVITDIGIREEENIITHEEVLQAAKEAEPRMTKILTELVKRL